MGVDLEVVFAATLTAEQTFTLPERLNASPAVVGAGRDRAARYGRFEATPWEWHDFVPGYRPPVTSPSSIAACWAEANMECVMLRGPGGILYVHPAGVRMSALHSLRGFAADHEGCQAPIRRMCRAIAGVVGADRVLYLPDSGGIGDWPPVAGDLFEMSFDEALAQLTAWGPPVPVIGGLGYGNAVRSGFQIIDGRLCRADATPLSDDEIHPRGDWFHSGGVTYYLDGRPVPPEVLARPDLRGGFAYYVDDLRDLA